MELNLDSFFQAMDHAAAIVYHDLLATGTAITDWKLEHPIATVYIEKAVALGVSFLETHGLDIPAIEVAANAVMGALKKLAALDATVTSFPPALTAAILPTIPAPTA